MTTIIASLETKNQQNPLGCTLCEQPLGQNAAEKFCCKGCEAVYQILSAQNQVEKRGEHPLFLQAVKYGVISNPELKVKLGSTGKERYGLEIRGMWCPACATLISLLLSGLNGVTACKVDYMTDFAAIEFDPMLISKGEMRKQIEAFGYQCLEMDDPQRKRRESSLTLRLAVCFFCAMNVMMFTYPLYGTFFDFDSEQMAPLLAWVSLILTVPVITYGAMPIYRRFALSCRQGSPGMETLVVIGIISSLLLSLYEMLWGEYGVYFDTVTMLITLLLLGRVIEQTAKFSAKEAWFQLHRTLPVKARLETGEIVALKNVQEGDSLIVLQGEKVPLDGIVMDGKGACDESSLTGESLPISKQRGDSLIAGSLLQSGRLLFRAVTTAEKSSIQQLLNSVQKELGCKDQGIAMGDRIATYFTPVVLMIVFSATPLLLYFGYSWTDTLVRSLAVLLIACPCAIGIAAPLVESRLIHCFARQGAIVRNRNLFKKLSEATLFAFDKTGTLTEGTLQLVNGFQSLSEDVLRAIETLSAQSNHPMSKAMQSGISQEAGRFEAFHEHPGKGLEGLVGDERYFIGSRQFLMERGVECPQLPSERSAAFVAQNGLWIATLEFIDSIRYGAESLPPNRVMLSGDRSEAVRSIAEQLGFRDYHAEMTPSDKKQWIQDRQNQGETVVFVGDGINDAPALSVADVGISLVSAADISFHVSDLYLLSGRLDQFQALKELTVRGQKLMRQNFFWAFFYNALGIPLAVTGLLSPLFATFAMAMSSLIVLLNSRRISLP